MVSFSIPRKVIIDCDPGIDDAVALCMALFEPRLEVMAVTAVAGNVPAGQATLNVQAVIDQLDPPRLPRVGSARSLEGVGEIKAHLLHGKDGLGGTGVEVSQLHQQHAAEKILCDQVRSAPGEIAGAAAAMRKHMVPIRSSHKTLVDTCGTGGAGLHTFNISTAAALVAAASGTAVAKHGNRKITSQTGSADVLVELGVNIEAPVEIVEECLQQLGICFCFAPLLHPAMKHVATVRKQLGVPTIFNLLGPLCNPAAAPNQLLGVGRPELRTTLAEALAMLGTERALVVTGADGMDELTLTGDTYVTLVENGSATEQTWTPADFGMSTADLTDLQVENPHESAERILGIFRGEPGPGRDIVVMNAAAAIWLTGQETSLEAAAQQAAAAIDDGRCTERLDQLVQLSHQA